MVMRVRKGRSLERTTERIENNGAPRRSRLSCPSSLASAEESEKYGLKTAAAKIVVNQQSGEQSAGREGGK